jgi:hypothetical protein
LKGKKPGSPARLFVHAATQTNDVSVNAPVRFVVNAASGQTSRVIDIAHEIGFEPNCRVPEPDPSYWRPTISGNANKERKTIAEIPSIFSINAFEVDLVYLCGEGKTSRSWGEKHRAGAFDKYQISRRDFLKKPKF